MVKKNGKVAPERMHRAKKMYGGLTAF